MNISLSDKIYIAGHKGMVGSAIHRELIKKGYKNFIFKTHKELDLLNQKDVVDFFEKEKPDIVILAAARVGGILANVENPGAFIYENLQVQNNVIHSSYLSKVKKFIFLGSSCIYPRDCPQPMREEYLLTGPFEPTNEGYALAKTAGLKMVEFYRQQYGFNGVSVMPCNLYGPNDNFDPKSSHVLSALIKKFVDASNQNKEEVVMWGTGKAKREFMYVEDMATAVVVVMENYNENKFINIGTGTDLSIKKLAQLISKKVNYKGKILWDKSKPDGMPRKCLDITKLENLGFKASTSLETGIENMIKEYKRYCNKIK